MEYVNRKQPFGSRSTADLYQAVVYQSRQVVFFKEFQVPDTPQGRFEMLALHLALMLRRLKFLKAGETERFSNLAQDLCDWVVADVEESLRAMRVSELKIPKHLKGFIEGFYGRLMAYDKALELQDKAKLEDAVRRNVYGTVSAIEDDIVKKMAAYIRQTWEWLQKAGLLQIIMDLRGR